jgi:raffinose/stachyose/melibiose transport system permease protein
MNKSMSRRVVIYAVLSVFLLIWMYPVYMAVIKSLNINGLGNYRAVIDNPDVRYLKVVANSFIISAGTAAIVVVVTSLAGYAFAKMDFFGKRTLYVMLLACLAVPTASVTMPMFFTIKNLNLVNTYGGVILPLVAFNALLMLVLMRNYYNGIPNELLEAATTDGASSLTIFLRIMLPLSLPIVATVGVLTFVYSWNDYLIPLLFIRDESKFTVTIAATYYMDNTSQSPSQVAQLYASLILMTIPSVLVYLVSQRYLQAGITAGAVKS